MLTTANAAGGEIRGKIAIITGSSSCIGLSIADAFANAGMNVLLNGFGDRMAIEKTRSGIGQAYGVQALYSGTKLTKPLEIASTLIDAGRTSRTRNFFLLAGVGTRFSPRPPAPRSRSSIGKPPLDRSRQHAGGWPSPPAAAYWRIAGVSRLGACAKG